MSDCQFFTKDSVHGVRFNPLLYLCSVIKLLNTAQYAHNYRSVGFITLCASVPCQRNCAVVCLRGGEGAGEVKLLLPQDIQRWSLVHRGVGFLLPFVRFTQYESSV